MCPPPDPEEGLHLTSTIEELKSPIPELFNVEGNYTLIISIG
jgi:hypothetical protein